MNGLVAEKKFTFAGHKGPVYALETGQLPHLFYSGSGDRLVVEWNLLTKEPGTVILTIPHIIYSLKYLSGKNLLFAGQSNGGLHVVDLGLRKEIKLLAYHKGPVFDLAFSMKHGLLLSTGGDGYVVGTLLSDFSVAKACYLGTMKIRSVIINPEETKAIIGCQDGTIAVLSLPDLELETRFEAHKSGFSVNSSLFISEGNYLISGSRDACLNIFDARSGFSRVESIPSHNYALYHIVNSPDKRYFATASRDKTIKIWDPANMKVVARLDIQGHEGHKNSVNRLLWASNNSLLSGSDDRSIIEWKINPDFA